MQVKPKIKVTPASAVAPRFPIYLTAEEVSHIALALEYVDMEGYCDNDILNKINAKMATFLANHYLGAM